MCGRRSRYSDGLSSFDLDLEHETLCRAEDDFDLKVCGLGNLCEVAP
jgi:hypothetical protein